VSILSTLETELLQWLEPLGTRFNFGIEELTAYSLKRVIQHHQVYVNYSNRSFEYVNYTDAPLVQDISFDIYIRFLDLRSHDSAYPILDALIDRLRKFEPDGVQVIQPLSIKTEKFLADMVDDGIWVYQQTWSIQIQTC
jgi:hypothetical protein